MNRKINFMNENYYHICNRGVSGMSIYKDIKDYLHFLACLKEFNTLQHIEFRILHLLKQKNLKPISPQIQDSAPLIELIAYCLIPNHYHIIVKQNRENGVVLFMQKLGTGYTMYFNARHNTQGHLFQGKFYVQEIATDDQLLYTTAYIHLNPLKRKEEQLLSMTVSHEQFQKISLYPWSSLPEYLGNISNLYFNLPELKHVKPSVKKDVVSSILRNQTYQDYLLNFWGRKKVYQIKSNLV